MSRSLSPRLVMIPRHSMAIERHAEAAYPEECCGVLIGRPLSDQHGHLVEQVLPARNDREEGRDRRFVISPEIVLAAHKQARAKGREVIGYYHSHPDHPARPSAHDREHARPGVSYLIVSVERGKAAEVKSWRLPAGAQDYEEEAVVEPALPSS